MPFETYLAVVINLISLLQSIAAVLVISTSLVKCGINPGLKTLLSPPHSASYVADFSSGLKSNSFYTPPLGLSAYSGGYGFGEKGIAIGKPFSGPGNFGAVPTKPLGSLELAYKILAHFGQGSTTVSHKTETVPIPVPQPIITTVTNKVPYPVPFPHPVAVHRPVAISVPKPVPVHIDKPVPVPIDRPVPVPVAKPVFVPVPKPVEISVPQGYPVDVPVPVSTPLLLSNGLDGGFNSGGAVFGANVNDGNFGGGHGLTIGGTHGFGIGGGHGFGLGYGGGHGAFLGASHGIGSGFGPIVGGHGSGIGGGHGVAFGQGHGYDVGFNKGFAHGGHGHNIPLAPPPLPPLSALHNGYSHGHHAGHFHQSTYHHGNNHHHHTIPQQYDSNGGYKY